MATVLLRAVREQGWALLRSFDAELGEFLSATAASLDATEELAPFFEQWVAGWERERS